MRKLKPHKHYLAEAMLLGYEYAEGFHAYRIPGGGDLDDLLSLYIDPDTMEVIPDKEMMVRWQTYHKFIEPKEDKRPHYRKMENSGKWQGRQIR